MQEPCRTTNGLSSATGFLDKADASNIVGRWRAAPSAPRLAAQSMRPRFWFRPLNAGGDFAARCPYLGGPSFWNRHPIFGEVPENPRSLIFNKAAETLRLTPGRAGALFQR